MTVHARYYRVRPLKPGETAQRTLEAAPGILIDLDAAGDPIGIEVIGWDELVLEEEESW